MNEIQKAANAYCFAILNTSYQKYGVEIPDQIWDGIQTHLSQALVGPVLRELLVQNRSQYPLPELSRIAAQQTHTTVGLRLNAARRLWEQSFEINHEQSSSQAAINTLDEFWHTANAWCPTGEGGGKDNSCSPNNKNYQQSLSGEYWLQDGQAMFADGDIGDMNHEGYAVQQAQREVIEVLGAPDEFLGDEYTNWDEFEGWLEEQYGEDQDAQAAAMKEVGISDDLFQVAFSIGNTDPRAYAAEHWDWIRMQGNNVQMKEIAQLKSLADGIADAHPEIELDNESFTIETKTAYYTDVPWAIINTGDVAVLREFKSHGTPGWGGVSNAFSRNIFCATGKDGGKDPTCTKDGGGSGVVTPSKSTTIATIPEREAKNRLFEAQERAKQTQALTTKIIGQLKKLRKLDPKHPEIAGLNKRMEALIDKKVQADTDVERWQKHLNRNAFCPTGEGGGQDNSCPPTKAGEKADGVESYIKHKLKLSSDGEQILRNYAKTFVRPLIHRLQQGGWKTSNELTVSNRTGNRHNVADDLKALVDIGVAQRAWDNNGMAFYAHEKSTLPRWLTKSDDDTVMISLPGRDQVDNAVLRNAFCPTGEGGGQDNSCPPNSKGIHSEAFKKWFKGSRVTDKNGKPLVVYHGSTKSFDSFKTDLPEDKDWGMLDRALGAHFAEDASVTDVFTQGQYVWPSADHVSENPGESWYKDSSGELKYDGVPVLISKDENGNETVEPYDSKIHGGTWGVRDRLGRDAYLRVLPPGGSVYPVYLSIKNPLVVEPIGRESDQAAVSRVVGKEVFAKDRDLFVSAMSATGRGDETAGKIWDSLHAGQVYDGGQYEIYKSFEDVSSNFPGMLNGKENAGRAKEILTKLGYDGIQYTNTSQNEVKGNANSNTWVVFSPTQIKSATGNKGTYDSTNDSILNVSHNQENEK